MRDRRLEGKIELLKKFIERWVGFRDFLRNALRNKTISVEKEKEFLEIKSQVTRKYQGLTQALGMDFTPDEKLMDIISHAVSLESMAGTSDMQFRKMESDWHLSYIHLNKLLGNLENQREQLSRVNGAKVILGRFASGIRGLCRVVVKMAIILFFLVLVGLVGSYWLPREANREGLVNYLVTTVRGIIFKER